MHLLTPVLRDYAWGTTTDIAQFLGREATGGPVAEAWWGAHEESPSTLHHDDGAIALDKRIADEPVASLGDAVVDQWGARLPYLLKVLAVAKPLSIQVHPRSVPARAGFERERSTPAGHQRTFHDPFHKPEMVMAITPMRVLVGVRPLEGVRADLARIGTPGADQLAEVIADDIDEYIRLALAGGTSAETLAGLARAGAAAPAASSLRASADALASFPGDAGALVALAMNVVDLAPGEAVFTGAGVLHSYQSGFGLEIMANSDNVARAGLTPKPVDVPLLLDLAATEPCEPERPTIYRDGAAVTLTTHALEFALTTVTDGGASVAAGPRIVLALTGEATIQCDASSMALTRGQAAFVGDSDGAVAIEARGTAVVAHVPPWT